MRDISSDSPEWSFSIDEISPGVYKAVGSDVKGRRVELTGTDPGVLMARCKAAALEIARGRPV